MELFGSNDVCGPFVLSMSKGERPSMLRQAQHERRMIVQPLRSPYFDDPRAKGAAS
jgi:hypothetical protein